GVALLVLDNVEQLAGAAEAAGALRRLAPAASLLATSRQPLGSEAELVLPVAPLELPAEGEREPALVAASPAVQLFLREARRFPMGASIDPGGGAELLGEVVRRLDGLPLALKLAAARLDILSLPELRGRLAARFLLLRDPSAHNPRHAALYD